MLLFAVAGCSRLSCEYRTDFQLYTLHAISKSLLLVIGFVHPLFLARPSALLCGLQSSHPRQVSFPPPPTPRIPGNADLQRGRKRRCSSLEAELRSNLQNTFLSTKAPSQKWCWQRLNSVILNPFLE